MDCLSAAVMQMKQVCKQTAPFMLDWPGWHRSNCFPLPEKLTTPKMMQVMDLCHLCVFRLKVKLYKPRFEFACCFPQQILSRCLAVCGSAS